MGTIDSSWHLSQDQAEAEVTHFELQFWRVFHGFMRWQEECEKSVNATGLNGYELSILHVVRMKNKAKTSSDIGRILNRQDDYNVSYILRKLIKMGLIRTLKKKGTKLISYEITPKGTKNTDVFSGVRREILVNEFAKAGLPLEELANNLIKIRAIYDQADTMVLEKINVIETEED